MDDNAFRIVIAAGVGLAAIGSLVLAASMFAIYRVAKGIEGRLDLLAGRVEPVLGKLEPVVEKAGPLLDRVIPAVEKAGNSAERIGRVADKAAAVLASVNHIVEDNRPRVAEVCGEAVAMAEKGRQQVDRIGELLDEAGDRARNRLEQIDGAVENTVDQVEHAGDSIRDAVLRPVREVNGLAAGISAAVSSLVKGGSRRSSVDSATQDEEMFI
jgi:ABC-type transporter Mla subunit MlaD